MNKGIFSAQINQIEHLLKKTALLKERNKYPAYSKQGISQFKELSYLDIWRKCYDEKLFDFILYDDSLIQFRGNQFGTVLDVSYVYYECPYIPMVDLDDFIAKEKFERGYDIDNRELLQIYELLTPELKETVTPLRYDYNPEIYTPGRHPVSHIHFGYKNDIRIGTKKILHPCSFILFIIRQNYPDKWDILKIDRKMTSLKGNIRSGLDKVPDDYFQELDLMEMYLE